MNIIKKLFQFFFISKDKTYVFYIKNKEGLPKPLDSEEELEAIESFMNGDEQARKKLIVHNLRLVVYIAKKYDVSTSEMEDLISIGTIGLIKAVNTFKREKGIKLVTYASRCIENEILMHLRKKNRRKVEVSFDEPLNVDYDGNELLLSDIIGTEHDIVSKEINKKEEKKQLLKALDSLKNRERMIMKMRYGIGYEELTQKDVADILGISQSYISRLEKKIISKLRIQLKEKA